MGTQQQNPNIDLVQNQIKEINAEELQKLLQDFKDKKNTADIFNNFDLNKNSTSLSETENKIIQKLHKLGNVDDQIKYLEALVSLVNMKKSLTKFDRKTIQESQIESMPTNIIGPDGTTINPEKTKKEQELREQQKAKIEEITKEFNSLNDLLNNKEKRRSILNIAYPEGDCPVINFKNGKDNSAPDLSVIKNRIAEQENKEIVTVLKGILPESEINNILNGGCNAENLREKLKATAKFTDFEVESLINGIAGNKKTLAQIYLRNKLKEKGTSLKEFINIDGEKEKAKFLNSKNFTPEEQKNIISHYANLENANNAEIQSMINILKFGLEGYNEFNLEYFENNPEDIKLITKKEKLNQIIKGISYDIEKGNNIKKISKITKTPLNELINYKFLNNINILESVHNSFGKKLSFDEIQNLDIKNLENDDLAILFNITNTSAIHVLMSELFLNSKTEDDVNKDKKLQQLLSNPKLQNKNEILDFIKLVFKNYNPYKAKSFNALQFLKGVDTDNNSKDVNTLELLKDVELNDIEQNIFDLINGNISKTDLIRFDNYLLETLTEFEKKDSQDENIYSMLELIIEHKYKFMRLSKTASYIMKSPELIDKFIKINPDIYLTLSEELKQEHAITYIDSLLENKDTIYEIERKISKLKLKSLKQKNIIYKKLEKSLTKEQMDKVLLYPEFRISFSDFLERTEKETIINNGLEENKKIKNSLKTYEKNNKDYEAISNKIIGKNLNELKDKEYTNKLESAIWNNELINYLQTLNPDLQSAMAGYMNAIIDSGYSLKEGGNNTQTYLSKLVEYTNGDIKEYEKILRKVKERIIKVQEELEKKSVRKVNDMIKENIEDKNALKLLELLDENKNFDKEKFKILYKKKLETKIKELKKQGKEYNLSDLKTEVLNEYLNNINISKELKAELNEILIGINIKENAIVVEKTYANKKAYNILKSGDKKAIEKLHKQYENNYISSIRQDIKEYKIEQELRAIPEKQRQAKRLENVKYPMDSKTGKITITENGKTDTIQLSQSERLLVEKSPETLANIVDFYKTLGRLGLKKLWTQKEGIFKAIENKIGIGFNIDSNYLNENEIKIFLNSILKSVGEEKISPVFTLDSFLVKMETINKTQAMGGAEAIVNTYYGETYLENKFFERFVGRNNTIIGFRFSEFESSLSGKQEQPDFSFDTSINNYIK